jgi:transcriptional regulator with XRE-family HTH domain
MTIREQLRAAYLTSGLTVTEISVAAGVSENTILNIFRGRNVTASNLFAVASVLRVRALDVPQQQMSA